MKQHLFKPTDEEQNFIYENIDSWTNYCRENLKRDMNQNRFNKWNQAGLYLLMTLIGLVFSFIGLIVQAPSGIIASIFILGGVLVVFGVFGIVGVYRYV